MKALSILAIVFASVLIVACSGSSAPANTDTPTDAPQEGAADTPEAMDDSAPKTPAVDDSKDAKSMFASAFSGKVEYMVAYDLTSNAGGQSVNAQMTQYMKVASSTDYKFRTDSVFSGIETRSYVVDNTITSCTKFSGSWNCQEQKSEQQSQNPRESAQMASEDSASTVTADGTMKVAGVTADCYKVSVKDGSSRYCLYQNVPLYVKTSDKDGKTISELTAISFKTSVADSDFEPPAEPSSGAAGSTFPAGQMPEGFDPSDYMAK